MERRGLTIIEFLVYLVLFTLISTMTASWIAHLWTSFMKQSKERVSLINMYTAHDCLVRDIVNCSGIIHCSARSLILQEANGAVEWALENKRLTRTQGAYDINNQEWKKKTKNIIAPVIEKTLFNKENHVISFSLQQGKIKVENNISLRSQRVPWAKKRKVDQH